MDRAGGWSHPAAGHFHQPAFAPSFVLYLYYISFHCISISDFTCIAVPLVVLYWYLYKNQVSTVFVLIARFGPFPCPLGQENWPPALLATMATSLKYFLWKEEEGGLILASSTGGHLSKEFSVKEDTGQLCTAVVVTSLTLTSFSDVCTIYQLTGLTIDQLTFKHK